MTDKTAPEPTELGDEDLEHSGGWLFEGCYKHSAKMDPKPDVAELKAPERDVLQAVPLAELPKAKR